MKRTSLNLVKVEEVSLVDRGDNPQAHVLIHKRAPAPSPQPSATRKTVGDHMVSFFAKALNKPEAEVRKWWGDADTARTFDDVYNTVSWEEVCDEVWQINVALTEAICGTLKDPHATGELKNATITTSVLQHRAALADAIPLWVAGRTTEPEPEAAVVGKSGRKISGERLALLEAAHQQLGQILADVTPAPAADTPTTESDMAEIDKNKGTDGAEAAAAAAQPQPGDDVLKGVTDPALRAVIQKLQADAAADRSRAEELAKKVAAGEEAAAVGEIQKRLDAGGDLHGAVNPPTAEQLRKVQVADPDTFEAITKSLAASAEVVRKGDLFKVIGSSGAGADGGDAMSPLVAKANELRAADTTLSMPQAIAKAVELNPSLAGAARAAIVGGH